MAGFKDRATGKEHAAVMSDTKTGALPEFVASDDDPETETFQDDAATYRDLTFSNAVVKYSINPFVNGKVHVQGAESSWVMLKRGHNRTYHKIIHEHLGRSVIEFVGRHNKRGKDTTNQTASEAHGLESKERSTQTW